MVEWHHRCDGHEFEQAPGVGDGQGSMVCCSPWGRKELDMTEPNLPLEKPICRTGSNSQKWTWNNRLVPNRNKCCQDCISSLCLFNLHAEYIMRNTKLEEAQARIKIAKRNIKNLGYVDDTTLMEECEEELKSLLMKESERGE